MNTRPLPKTLAGLAGCVIIGLLALLLAPGALAGEPYTFGVVPQYDQRQLFAIWKPLLEELQKETGLAFRLVSVPSIPAFEKEFLNGSYDFAYMNPYHVLKAEKSQGYAPLVRDLAPCAASWWSARRVRSANFRSCRAGRSPSRRRTPWAPRC